MSLPRLSRTAVGQLAADHAADPEALYELTNGNPFFVTEVLANNGHELPAGVRDAVLGRAARLSPEGRSVLEAAAVIGMHSDPVVLRNVAGGPIERQVDECLAIGLLEATGGALTFRHAIAWRTIRSNVSPVRCVALNRRLLTILRRDPRHATDHARLAYHAEEARDEAAVVSHAMASAVEASRLQAHREAAAQYARVLRFGAHLTPRQRADLHGRESRELYLSGQFEPALDTVSAGVELWRQIDDPVRLGDSLRWLSQLLWFAGKVSDARARSREALDLLLTQPVGPELAWTYASMSQHLMQSDREASIALGERAMELAEETGAREALVHAACTVGTIKYARGDNRGRQLLERSLALAMEADYEEHVARALYNLAATAAESQLATAATYATDGLTYCTEHDLVGWECAIRVVRGYVRAEQGDWTSAWEDVTHLLEHPLLTAHGRLDTVLLQCWLATLQGTVTQAALDGVLEESVRATGSGRGGSIPFARAIRAEAALFQGDKARSLHEAREGLALPDVLEDRRAAAQLALVVHRAGGDTAGLDPVEESARLQLSGDWRAAAACWRAMGMPLETARALMGGDEAAVLEAWEIFDRLGARPDAKLALTRLRELGVRRLPHGARAATRANPAGLTTRELEVLTMLVSGAPDREIAQRLFLSPRTVGHHVSSILGKLDVPTRRAAAEMATTSGMIRAE
jgi:DNA-binding CsgD family transcriptional regulator